MRAEDAQPTNACDWYSTLGVVVVHFDNFPEVCDTIENAIEEGVAEGQVVIVDNSASPRLREWVADRRPSSVLVAGQGNVGYAAAVNLGAEVLRDRGLVQCLILTHEVIMRPGTIDQLVRALTGAVAVTAPVVYRKSDPGTSWSYGGELRDGSMYPIARDSWIEEPPDWVDGCCFLMRLDVHLQVGGLYEPYFLYLEEIDFFVRLRRLGYQLRVVQTASVLQEPGGMSLYHAIRNRILLVRRLGRTRAWLQIALVHTMRGLVEVMAPRRRRRGLERLGAVKDGLRVDRGDA